MFWLHDDQVLFHTYKIINQPIKLQVVSVIDNVDKKVDLGKLKDPT